MNERVFDDERIERLRRVAISLIKNYISSMYGEKDGIAEEIDRIENEFSRVEFIKRNIVAGSPTMASNDRKGHIDFYFQDVDNISDAEIDELLGTLVHEFYHSVSRSKPAFLEEGFVTYITAKTIRYSIDNMPDIEGVDKEDLRENLKKQNLINGYKYASEFVRSLDIVMKMSGYDATYVYMFNEDGAKALAEVASNFSSELAKIIQRQSIKTATNSKNLVSELSFFRSFFKEMNVDMLNITSVEMNNSLQNFLASTKPFNQNEEVLNLLGNICPGLLKYKELLTEIRYLPSDERRKKIIEYLPTDDIEWQLKEKPFEVVKSISSDLKKQYERSDSKFNAESFGSIELFTIPICYDMLQKYGGELDESKVKEYVGYLAFDPKSESLCENSIKTYFEKVKQETKNGKGLREIINDVIADKVEFVLEIAKIRSDINKENYMDGVIKIAEVIKKFGYDRNNDFYVTGYGSILGVMQNYYGENRIYNVADLNAFRSQMQLIFDIAHMPNFVKENGYTIDKIFITSIMAATREGDNNFSKQMLGMLELFSSGDLELGYATGDLEDFSAKVYTAFEDIKLSSTEEKTAFINTFLHNFLMTDNLKATNVIERKSKIEKEQPNRYLSRVLDGILADGEFWNEKTINDAGVEISNFENIFQNSEKSMAKTLGMNQSFLKMFSTQMLGNSPKPEGESYSICDMRKELLGKTSPTVADIYLFDYSSYSDFVPFFLKAEAKENIENRIESMRRPIDVGIRLNDTLKGIIDFEMVGESEFAESQTKKIIEKLNNLDMNGISTYKKAEIALTILSNENERSSCLEQLKGQNNFFEDIVNGLKQYARLSPFNMKEIAKKLEPFGEKSGEVSRVLDFLSSEDVWKYSEMKQEPVLTPKKVEEMAKQEKVQECIPYAEGMLEKLEQKREEKKEMVER